MSFQVVLTIGSPPHPELRLNRTRVRAVLPSNLRELNDGLIGAAIPLNTLARIDNPYCLAGASAQCPRNLPQGSTLVDLVSVFAGPSPDIDGDGDGLECVLDDDGNGVVDGCCDGLLVCPLRSFECGGRSIPPITAVKSSCATDPRMADGYSVGIRFQAVAANIIGFAD
ncbi:MAG: hypothetical protein HC923_05995 [Myxococcales bacterium]|nr:hypothetical protein [Myxococcales bacterium]